MEHNHHPDDHNVCCSSDKYADVHQSFVEMEFERGIWSAAQYNELDRVKALLNKGVAANVEDSAGYTALHYAARNGHYEVCKTLLENGAKINAQTRCGRATPLHRAAMQGHVDIVQLLLQSGANADIKDTDGYTALHKALAAGSVSVCKLLIKYTDLRIASSSQLSVEQLAKEKCPEVFALLLDCINTKYVNSVSVCKLLIKYTDLRIASSSQLSVEQLAKEKCPEVFALLLDRINTKYVK